MKTKQLFLSLAILLFCNIVSLSQNPVSTLEHDGTTQVFYGQGSFVDAYNASVSGDQIYLSTGFFAAPTSIAKGIKIIGASHFPDSANVAKRTFIIPAFDGGGLRLNINAGADSLHLEGLYINGDIKYDAYNSINYVKVLRCRLSSAYFQSNSATATKSHCSFEECFIDGIDCAGYVTNLFVKHCILNSAIYNINGSALIDGNIFLSTSCIFNSVYSSIIKNNIVLSRDCVYDGYSYGNSYFNNLFIRGSWDFPLNTANNNYLGIPQADIFINQTGNAIDYTHDYHLKNPEQYIGTDETQVGIYGGTTPFKEKGLPSNPQIINKNIADQTDTNGNLPINFTVKAQKN